MDKKSALTGINVQFPISQLIVDGTKTIETRTYPIPKKYLNVPLVIIETPGKLGKFKSRAIGIVIFINCFEYESEVTFYEDVNRHRVERNSPWRWIKGKKKWGWVVGVVTPLQEPQNISQKKGIVFTKGIKLR
jgi:hypothetical protein